MKITCRLFLALLFVASVGGPLIAPAHGGGSPKPAADKPYLVFVGTYTNKTISKGIYAFRFDPGTGKLDGLGVAAEAEDPSFIAIHPNGKYLYAVNEIGRA